MNDDAYRLTITCTAADGSRLFDEIRRQHAETVADTSSVTISGSEAVLDILTTTPHEIAGMTLVKLLGAKVSIATA